MARVEFVECDKCGKQFTHKYNNGIPQYHTINIEVNTNAETRLTYDLCNDCIKFFRNIITDFILIKDKWQ